MFITALFSIARIGTQPKCPLTDECTWGSLESESHSVVSDSLQPHELYSPWNSPGQNTGVGSLSLLQGSSQSRDRTQVSCREYISIQDIKNT